MKRYFRIVFWVLSFTTAFAQTGFYRFSSGPYGGEVQHMIFAANGTIFAGERTAGGGKGVARSTDGGVSWKFVNSGLTNTRTSMILQAKNGDLIASTGFDLAKSTNNGDTWTKIASTSVNWTRGLVAGNGTIYMTDENGSNGFYKSTNNGATWTASGNLANPANLTLDSSGNLYVYMSLSSTSKKSTDGGTTWTTLTSMPGTKMTVSKEGHLYAISGSDVYKSTNGGSAWRKTLTSTAVIQHTGINFSPDGTLWVGSYECASYSLDTGATWVKVDSGINRSRKQVFSITNFVYGPKGEVFALSSAGIYKLSVDKKYWQGIGLPTSTVRGVCAYKNELWATGTNGIMLSTDKGATWVFRNLQTYSESGRINVNDTAVFVVNPSKKVSYSKDHGLIWTDIVTGIESETVSDFYFARNGDLLASTTSGIFKWTKTGWVKKATTTNNTRMTKTSTGTLLALGGSKGLLRSTDNGDTWDTTQTITNIKAIAGDSSGNFYAGVAYTGDIYKSADGGKTFARYLTLPIGGTNAIVVDKSGNIFVIPTSNAIRKMRDSVITTIDGYSASGSGYGDVCFDADGYLYVGTSGDGMLISNNPTLTAVQEESREMPEKYVLSQNYPNPFNPTTNIEFQIPNGGFVTLKVFDLLGKQVRTLLNTAMNAGSYRVTFDGNGLSSGMYFYRLQCGNFSSTKKLLLAK